ncbi:hypothetical protein niasHS_010460 [Heterodera schachtii]|uniref:Uncharacterized protein n=1 Tax=Heterodera schachtii TaxID=97005 RepID=A0ABD2J4Y0_HETSC
MLMRNLLRLLLHQSLLVLKLLLLLRPQFHQQLLADLFAENRFTTNAAFAQAAKMITALAFVPLEDLTPALATLEDHLSSELRFVINYVGRLRNNGTRTRPLFRPDGWSVIEMIRGISSNYQMDPRRKSPFLLGGANVAAQKERRKYSRRNCLRRKWRGASVDFAERRKCPLLLCGANGAAQMSHHAQVLAALCRALTISK